MVDNAPAQQVPQRLNNFFESVAVGQSRSYRRVHADPHGFRVSQRKTTVCNGGNSLTLTFDSSRSFCRIRLELNLPGGRYRVDLDIDDDRFDADMIESIASTNHAIWDLIEGTPRRRAEFMRVRALRDRKNKWDEIQDRYPDHAEIMNRFSKVFGRPASVTMVAADGAVIL